MEHGGTSPFLPNTFGNWEAKAAFEVEAAAVKNCSTESLKIFRNVSLWRLAWGINSGANEDKDWWCSVDNPGRNAGLLLGIKFLWFKECSCCKFNCCARVINLIWLYKSKIE